MVDSVREKITPISASQQQRVCALTTEFVHRANTFFRCDYPVPKISFDLTGRAAGMFRVKNALEEIRYNPYTFAKYFADNLAITVPHEVAHYICYKMHLPKRVPPHGKEWQHIMQVFGVKAERTCNYDLSGIPTRQHKRHAYGCSCTQYEFTTRRHNQVVSGKGSYLCRKCGETIQPLSAVHA